MKKVESYDHKAKKDSTIDQGETEDKDKVVVIQETSYHEDTV